MRTSTTAGAAIAAIVAAVLLGPPGAAAGREESPIPNVRVTTQDGAAVRLYDDLVKDHAVLINFMFTSCKEVCPRATRTLLDVAKGLGPRLGKDVRIISVTVDPRKDTPARLKAFAAEHNAPGGWYFVTGAEKDIDEIRTRLTGTRDGKDKSDHTSMVFYGNDRTGQWAMTPVAASPKTIVFSLQGIL